MIPLMCGDHLEQDKCVIGPRVMKESDADFGSDTSKPCRAGVFSGQFLRSFFQFSFAVLFIWFGALKIFGVSPAYELVTRAFAIFPPHVVNLGLGVRELATGILFLLRPTVKLALLLMALQIPGTFLPLFVVPEICFVKIPWILTTNGEFILKNLLMIGGGLVLYGSNWGEEAVPEIPFKG